MAGIANPESLQQTAPHLAACWCPRQESNLRHTV